MKRKKQTRKYRRTHPIQKGKILLYLALFVTFFTFFSNYSVKIINKTPIKAQEQTLDYTPVEIPADLVEDEKYYPTPTPTIKPINEKALPVGFCMNIPVLLYHHVQPIEEAKKEGHAQLTVDSGFFEKQMQYLADHGYISISAEELVRSLINHVQLPGKTVVVTLDDGYLDNYQYAYPIAKKYNMKLNMMIPTGLLGNSGYMNWDNLKEMVGSGMVFAYDHTWSHYSITKGSYEKIEQEIMTAKKQLEEQLGKPQVVFTYPYGPSSDTAIDVLRKNGFLGAFTTISSTLQCDGYIYNLRRTHIGNAPLSSYGF